VLELGWARGLAQWAPRGGAMAGARSWGQRRESLSPSAPAIRARGGDVGARGSGELCLRPGAEQSWCRGP
jgi:hypothetical protein